MSPITTVSGFVKLLPPLLIEVMKQVLWRDNHSDRHLLPKLSFRWLVYCACGAIISLPPNSKFQLIRSTTTGNTYPVCTLLIEFAMAYIAILAHSVLVFWMCCTSCSHRMAHIRTFGSKLLNLSRFSQRALQVYGQQY